MRSKIFALIFGLLASAAAQAEIQTQRVDIHVDGERPIAGERSRIVRAPNGDLYFSYTLAAGDFSCKPLGIIRPNGEIELTAIDSESTWNVDGWGTFGFPFDLAFDDAGELIVATRHRGQPYGVDFWRDGKLESFGAGVTFGGNLVSLGILPSGQPVVVCLDRNKTQLAVWERNADGKWSATRPQELSNVVSGHFDLVVEENGVLRVLFCQGNRGPVCATRDEAGNWSAEVISEANNSESIAAVIDDAGRIHASFVSDRRKVNHAVFDGAWKIEKIAEVDENHHAMRTDVSAAAGRVVVVWERGNGPQAKPKDYGGAAGATMLSVIGGETHELVPNNAGRPSVALTADGKSAWVGVYSGNDGGDDFYLLKIALDGGEPGEARVVSGDPETMFRDGCLADINSGNAKAELRGLQRIDLSKTTSEQRIGLIEKFRNHENPLIRKSIVGGLAESKDALEHFTESLREVLDDPDPLVRKSFLERLEPPFVETVLEKAFASRNAMDRLVAAEVIRQNPDWIGSLAFDRNFASLTEDLGSEDAVVAGSASMALERLIDREGVSVNLGALLQFGTPIQRVRAALILFRTGHEIHPEILTDVAKDGGESAQLALCGLLGQVRSASGVPILQQLLESPHAPVRTAAVFALRSTAFVSELEPVAKHPKGFDLLALRPVAPRSDEESATQKAAVHALTRAVVSHDPNVREKAIDALARVGFRASSSPEDSDPGVRNAARAAGGGGLIDLKEWQRETQNRKPQKQNPVFRKPTEIVDGVIQAGSDKQLLIDDFVIAEKSGLVRRLHPFKKHPRNPVFQAQVDWEEGWADPFMSTVLYDPDERCFKMWYRCGPRHSLKAYAVSEDGIHWQRPDVATTPWLEFEHHNLLGFDGEIATWKKPGNNVQFLPAAADGNRFLSLFYQPPTKDFAISRSPDGIRWSQPEHVRQAHGDVVSLIRNPATEDFLFFPKYKRENDGFVRRSFAATTIQNVDSPFTANFPFLAGHREDALVADGACRAYGSLLKDTIRLSDFHAEIYSVTAIPYEGVVVALYDLWPIHGSAEGPLDMPMKVSRDMKTWTDVDFPRRALEIGRFGEWDSGMVYGGNTMLVVNDEIRLYYLGANMGHCTRVLPTTKPYHSLGVGLATLPLDRFASMRAEGEGEFTTKPMRVAGSRLEINAKCREGGSVRVEILDSDGNPIPGFALGDCEIFEGDEIRQTISWKGGSLPEDLSGPIQLRFALKAADVFAFQFKK